MNRGEYLTKLIEDKGFTIMSLSKSSGVPYTTIRSMIERNLTNASIDNVIKICKVLGVKVESLEKQEEIKLEDKEDDWNHKLPDLTSKDERNIQKELQKMIDGLNSNSSFAAFDGQGLEDLDEEDRELLLSSLENSLRIAKKLAKQKYTPKKYRK
ncbi:helix-turn-helix domain-containing protein [Metabacillus bambusae]|uniref:Helix-turn-helix transcriptional regulator n=1 Tax=Metabacillus bambusae TaxID=2795218 RepID=A0ABS3N4N1_9BACI|nr:helix-turn-helix transcriptional regulator [Metabacillus bambusae]MBO1513224.1 helix-turn-helix transcriptional regulator [Metabacillus bambusae]